MWCFWNIGSVGNGYYVMENMSQHTLIVLRKHNMVIKKPVGNTSMFGNTRTRSTSMKNTLTFLLQCYKIQLTWQHMESRVHNSPAQRVVRCCSHGRTGRTCRWASSLVSPPLPQTPSDTRQTDPAQDEADILICLFWKSKGHWHLRSYFQFNIVYITWIMTYILHTI